MKHLLAREGLSDRVWVESAGPQRNARDRIVMTMVVAVMVTVMMFVILVVTMIMRAFLEEIRVERQDTLKIERARSSTR